MSLEKRIDAIEKQYGTEPECNKIIYCPVDQRKPTRQEVEEYLKETGRCQRCRGDCILYWNGEAFA